MSSTSIPSDRGVTVRKRHVTRRRARALDPTILDPLPPRRLQSSTRTVRWLLTVVTGLIIIATFVLNWPAALGGRATWVMVMGESMEPTFHTGDMVIAWRTDDYGVGDLIVYAVGEDTRGRVIHRITDGNPIDGWYTRGDNKERIDPWKVPQERIMGEEVFSVPQLGTGFMIARSPIVLAFVAGAFVFSAVLASPGVRRRLQRYQVAEPALVAGMPATARDIHEAGGRFLVEGADELERDSVVPVEVWVTDAFGGRRIASGKLSVRYDNTFPDGSRSVGGPILWNSEEDLNRVLGHVTGYVIRAEGGALPRALAGASTWNPRNTRIKSPAVRRVKESKRHSDTDDDVLSGANRIVQGVMQHISLLRRKSDADHSD